MNFFRIKDLLGHSRVCIPVYFSIIVLLLPLSLQAATEQSVNLAQQMYVAYYGRPGDPEGMDYWAARFDDSADLDSVLSAFGSSQEYYDRFGELSNEALIDDLFEQMFNRQSDIQGAAFYVERLENGDAILASIAKQIADGRQNVDADRLNNKIMVANAFTQHVKRKGVPYTDSDISASLDLLAKVSEQQESVIAGLFEVDNFGVENEYASVQCKSPRPDICTQEYLPVCATRDNGIRCITTPCPSTENATYSNACSACADADVFHYRPEECQL